MNKSGGKRHNNSVLSPAAENFFEKGIDITEYMWYYI